MNRSPGRWALLVVFASLSASLVALAGPAAAGARCNSAGATDLTLTSQSDFSTHAFTIENKGPACAVDVTLGNPLQPIVVKSSDGTTPLTYQGIASSSSPTWSCTEDSNPAASAVSVHCSLGAAIPANKAAFVTIKVAGDPPSRMMSAEVFIPRNTAEPETSDNAVWGSFGTTASSSDFEVSADPNQVVELTRPQPRSSISINQPAAGSTLAAAEAGLNCGGTGEPACLLKRQVTIDTEEVSGNFPDVRLTAVITRTLDLTNVTEADVFARAALGQLDVYRFVDFGRDGPVLNAWVTVPKCQLFSGRADIGCVNGISALPDLNNPTIGILRIELWAQHNGHYR